LERALLARGYRRSSVHQVRTLSLVAFASRAESGAGAATATVAADGPTGAWLNGWGAAAGVSATARENTGRLLARVAGPAAGAVAGGLRRPRVERRGSGHRDGGGGRSLRSLAQRLGRGGGGERAGTGDHGAVAGAGGRPRGVRRRVGRGAAGRLRARHRLRRL